jgi:hypothetical protein
MFENYKQIRDQKVRNYDELKAKRFNKLMYWGGTGVQVGSVPAYFIASSMFSAVPIVGWLVGGLTLLLGGMFKRCGKDCAKSINYSPDNNSNNSSNPEENESEEDNSFADFMKYVKGKERKFEVEDKYLFKKKRFRKKYNVFVKNDKGKYKNRLYKDVKIPENINSFEGLENILAKSK